MLSRAIAFLAVAAAVAAGAAYFWIGRASGLDPISRPSADDFAVEDVERGGRLVAAGAC